MDQKYDALDSWREEVGIKTTKGQIKHYQGGSEYDPTYEALKAYYKNLEQQKQNKTQEELCR